MLTPAANALGAEGFTPMGQYKFNTLTVGKNALSSPNQSIYHCTLPNMECWAARVISQEADKVKQSGNGWDQVVSRSASVALVVSRVFFYVGLPK